MRHKKAVLDDLGGLVATLGYIAILAAIIFLIIASSKDTVEDIRACNATTILWNASSNQCCVNTTSCGSGDTDHYSAAYTAVATTQDATSDIPGWLPIVVITIIGGILLTLVRFFKSGQT